MVHEPELQTLPHELQLFLSELRSTQTPLQLVWPDAQQIPLWQVAPAPSCVTQLVPHEPQLAPSVWKFTHAPLHTEPQHEPAMHC